MQQQDDGDAERPQRADEVKDQLPGSDLDGQRPPSGWLSILARATPATIVGVSIVIVLTRGWDSDQVQGVLIVLLPVFILLLVLGTLPPRRG